MRLTKLKLAGFKSFADPITVALPGQLVGVVGPNGCGKSNVMDAVRWVLGESRASELRGDSMKDVIFNGSTNRKPGSRALVELVFDNALGRALGQWSQYSELAVKRVLTQSGQSDYFINNLKVRRKDITDLFLGTGLGPRAYAIIGQGMISRIIEARPDDLRVFLEEAAGVTRYKERRKETEGRLEDTRENLTRVEDIRQELAAQMEKLESQAEVARQYHDCNNALVQKQQMLWLIRRNDARTEEQKLALDVARAETEQEGATAALRETEARLETAREAHFTASDGVHEAQGALYAVNAETARLEAEIRHRKEARRQLEGRLAQLAGEEAHWRGQAEKLASEQGRWEELRELSNVRLEQAEAKLETATERLPLAEGKQGTTRAEIETLRRDIAQVEQRLQVELTHRTHAKRSQETLRQRRERLQQSAAAEVAPERAALEEREAEQALAQARAEELVERLRNAQEKLSEQEQHCRMSEETLHRQTREIAAAEARRNALRQMQAQASQGSRLSEWLEKYGLAEATPLWRVLRVEPGWETAVEAVLRERVNAIPTTENAAWSQWVEDRPGGRMSLRLRVSESGDQESRLLSDDSLLGRVKVEDARWLPLLTDWLGAARAVASLEEASRIAPSLPFGALLVTPGGDLVERYALHLFAPDASGHGLLERQQEIETLESRLDVLRAQAEASEAEVARLEADINTLREHVKTLSRERDEARQQAHALQVETLKLAQALEWRHEQSARLQAQLADLDAEMASEREREFAAEESVGTLREQVETLRLVESETRVRQEAAERALREAREQATACEREAREAQFSARECAGKLEEIVAQQALSERELKRIHVDLATCRAQEMEAPPEIFEEELRQALEKRQLREAELTEKRDAMEAAAAALRALEENRLRLEQSLEPLRERIGDLKLKAQAATLNAKQLGEQLQEAGADEAALAAMLATEANPPRPQALAQEIGRLQKAILELGAVNLAALQELDASRERKDYLDEQAADLTEAMETLESAIRRIDRETRDLLQSTFDTVNEHFGRLFPELFGGGRAALVMTGEEILDAGVQVFAQPPGKKNSTIHLLSGGEKALTAIALVFSMFQLNPAPFCLLDEVDAPLDDSNTERFCQMVKKMSSQTQFLFISHNKIAMEMAGQLVGVTMQESGVSRVVEVDMEAALKMREEI
jgi:chromosome segregation protein